MELLSEETTYPTTPTPTTPTESWYPDYPPQNDVPDFAKTLLIQTAICVGIAFTAFLLFKLSSYYMRKYLAKQQLQTIPSPNDPQSSQNHQVYTVDSDAVIAYGYTDAPPVYNDALNCKVKDSQCEGLPPSYHEAVTPT